MMENTCIPAEQIDKRSKYSIVFTVGLDWYGKELVGI